MKSVKTKKVLQKNYCCEIYTQFFDSGKGSKFWKWVVKPASLVTKNGKIRCQFCGCPVILHHGGKVTAHVEHIAGSQSVETCKAGSRFRKKSSSESGV